MKKTLILTAGLIGLAAVGANAQSLLPPRAQALFPEMGGAEKRAPGAYAAAPKPYLGTGTKAAAAHNTVAPGIHESDITFANRPIYTGKWPWETRPDTQFQIAPLKSTGKECGPDCKMPCCEKK